jgi:hypothetical protein
MTNAGTVLIWILSAVTRRHNRAMVSDGRITTDILHMPSVHQSRIRDRCRGRRRPTRQAHIGRGGYAVPCGQAQDAFGGFLSETSLSRRPAIRAATGAAGGGCEPGSFDPVGLPRRFGGTTSAIQLGGLPGPLLRRRASRSRLKIASSIWSSSIPFGSLDPT